MSRLWVTPEEMGDAGKSVYAYEASKTASFILWALSGRKYAGTSTVTERYECACRQPRFMLGVVQPVLFDYRPFLIDEVLGGNSGCGCSGKKEHASLRLRGRPVRSISRVVSAGVEVSPDEYQLVNASVLQSAPHAALDLCGIEVTYTYGVQPPTAGRRAARYLATELVKSYSGEDCALPERVTSVSRQGVSVTVLDNQTFLDDHRTGIYAVDLFLKTVNPDKARKRSRVFSPDVPRGKRTVQTSLPITQGPLDLAIVPGESFEWRLPLTGNYGSLLTDPDWAPQGQISGWNGSILYEASAGRFSVTPTELVFTMTPTETSRINLGGSGAWDLYAVSVHDNSTVVHVMTSNVFLVGHAPSVLI